MATRRKGGGCCTTTGIINKFSRCLCLRLPNLSKLSLDKQKEIDKEVSRELYEAENIYQSPKRPSQHKEKLQQYSTPRIPLGTRMLHKRATVEQEPEHSVDAQVRPITQLVGVSRVRNRAHRSVSRWAEKRRETGIYKMGQAEHLHNMCKQERVSFIKMVTQKSVPIKEHASEGQVGHSGSDNPDGAGRSRSMFRTVNGGSPSQMSSGSGREFFGFYAFN